jgi:septal ring factor EnvC (AmiA/AmiB activator)
LRSILTGSALLCAGCEDQITIKKQRAEIAQLQEEKRLLETERDRHTQSLAGCEKTRAECEEKLRKAKADIKTLQKTLSQKKGVEGKIIEKKLNVKQKSNVKHKKKGRR